MNVRLDRLHALAAARVDDPYIDRMKTPTWICALGLLGLALIVVGVVVAIYSGHATVMRLGCLAYLIAAMSDDRWEIDQLRARLSAVDPRL